MNWLPLYKAKVVSMPARQCWAASTTAEPSNVEYTSGPMEAFSKRSRLNLVVSKSDVGGRQSVSQSWPSLPASVVRRATVPTLIELFGARCRQRFRMLRLRFNDRAKLQRRRLPIEGQLRQRHDAGRGQQLPFGITNLKYDPRPSHLDTAGPLVE